MQQLAVTQSKLIRKLAATTCDGAAHSLLLCAFCLSQTSPPAPVCCLHEVQVCMQSKRSRVEGQQKQGSGVAAHKKRRSEPAGRTVVEMKQGVGSGKRAGDKWGTSERFQAD